MKMKYIFFLLALLCIISCETPSPNQPQLSDEIIDVTYGDHSLQNYTIHLPAGRSVDSTKVVILIHGGGWVMGYEPNSEITTFSGRYGWNILNPLFEKGYACVLMKYRTACYNTIPEEFNNDTRFYLDRMIEDINLVVSDLKESSEKFTIRNDHFQLIGESGGGHIVMAYGTNTLADTDIQSVVSMFGPTDLDDQEFKETINSVPLIFAAPPNYFLKQSDECNSVTNKQVRTLSSLKSFADHNTINILEPNPFLAEISTTSNANLSNNIPMFITHGAEDILVPVSQADAMYVAMQSNFNIDTCNQSDFSCQLKLSKYVGCGHGWTGGQCDKSQIMDDIENWIENH